MGPANNKKTSHLISVSDSVSRVASSRTGSLYSDFPDKFNPAHPAKASVGKQKASKEAFI
jgi:hypothetical protein